MKNILFLVLFLSSHLFSATYYYHGKNITSPPAVSYTFMGSDGKYYEVHPTLISTSLVSYITSTLDSRYYFVTGIPPVHHQGIYNCNSLPSPNERLSECTVVRIAGALVSSCPVGTSLNADNICVPSCADTEYLDENYQCVPDPNLADSDDDGVPDKCDPDYVDYLTMDCDGDGIPNANDPDIDGDGLLNGNDPTPNGSGSDGSTSGTSDTPCPATSYNLTPVKDQASCSMDNSLFFPIPDGETNYVKSVYWDECRQSCMASIRSCPYGQVIKDGVCKSVVPDEDDCIGTSNCQIDSWGVSPNLSCFKRCYCSTTLDPNPQTPYFSQEVSCSENYDDQAKVNDLELNSDVNDVNKTLPTDLLKDSNATFDLDISASMKVALDSYAGAKEATQLDLLSESKIQTLQLVGANSKLSDISTSLEHFSAVSTSNQGAINNTLKGIDTGIDTGNFHLGSIDDKMTTNNSLLEEIKGFLDDSNTSVEDEDEFSLDFLSSEIGTILSRYTIDLKSGGCSSIGTISTSLNGRTLVFLDQSTIDKLPVSEIRALIIFLFTIAGLSLAFRGN